MKRVSMGLMLSALMLAAVGCGGEGDNASVNGADSNNNCTQAYIDSFNDVVTSAQEVMSYYDSNRNLRDTSDAGLRRLIDSAKKMDRKCDAFLGSYRGVNCRAVSLSTGTTGYTDAAQMAKGCATIKDALNSVNGTSTQTAQITSAVIENVGSEEIVPFATGDDSSVSEGM